MSAFVDIFGEIVAAVRYEYDSDYKEPYYEYGHPLDIFNILVEKSKTEAFKYDKYPLIALFQDFKEHTEFEQTTVDGITIVIMMETSPTYHAKNRYENTFTPVLQPLYEILMEKIRLSKYVSSEDGYAHDKIDRLYYGKEDTFGNSGNIGNDALDAIVISGITLGINKCRTIPTYLETEAEIETLRITEGGSPIILG